MTKFILDTNILVYYLQADREKIRKIDTLYAPFADAHQSFMSIVSVAELYALAMRHHWGQKRWQQLLSILEDVIIVPIESQDLIDKYAEIDTFSQGKLLNKPLGMSSRNMGKNDIWIAATAAILNLPVITNDNDFEHLHLHFFQVHRID
jgi:tRNA(fMet)-specific endonuclease VapC